eukprot:CAMPEP_0194386068 /NCGR_PEP_ID=MMETSP0174-20130528/84286_1 /TAXON_ID=216777 /ORGANISM="Proboscia alata, Strain PI-D3" /LENGTH=48 /DNA_ID= /DNA_START= /DNA_END= /DNA_ORIENTATION=
MIAVANPAGPAPMMVAVCVCVVGDVSVRTDSVDAADATTAVGVDVGVG